MDKRTVTKLVAIVLFIVAGALGFFAYNGSVLPPITVTTEEAQQRINAALEKRALEEKRVNIEAATVQFVDNHIVVFAKASGIVRGRTVHADIRAKGVPEYRNGAFYFKPTERPHFENVTVERENKPGLVPKGVRDLVKKKADAVIEKHGLEPLAEELKNEFRNWVVSVAEKGAERALTQRPIYVLKDDVKGIVVKAVLEKVEVVGDKLIITLSLVQLAYSIFAALFMFAIGVVIVVGLAMSPGWALFGFTIGALSS